MVTLSEITWRAQWDITYWADLMPCVGKRTQDMHAWHDKSNYSPRLRYLSIEFLSDSAGNVLNGTKI